MTHARGSETSRAMALHEARTMFLDMSSDFSGSEKNLQTLDLVVEGFLWRSAPLPGLGQC